MKDKSWQVKISSWWHHYWPYCLIATVWLMLVVANYVPGSWLTGWDNLHPEWDPLYDLWRSFNSVWQEHQGLGLLGGMAHAADLPRQLVVALLSLVLPRSLIRYSLLWSMLLVGAIGCYRLFGWLFTNQREHITAKTAALAAALFYLLNLGTVQNFYVAFEPFYWFYGMLPWLLYYLHRVWRGHEQKNWLRLGLLSFVGAPLAYIQTNFVVYGLLLLVMGLAYLFSRRPKLSLSTKISRLLGSAALIVATNLFWLAPQAYFVLTGGSQVTIESQINQLSTKEVTIQNQAYENWRDFLLLRGYWFAGQDYNSTEDSEAPIAFMETWLAESSGTVFGYIFALLMMTGAIYLLIYRRDYRGVGVVLGLLAMWGLMLVNHLDSPLVGQIFRSPFTKAIVPISLLYSLLVGASFLFLARVIRPKFLLFAFGCYVMSLGIYSVPSFGGHFIYHNLRPIVPSDYEQLFAFMHTQPEAARTALLPAETAYGWQHTTWGYRGIGFYWFGMRQAMLNRTFDVWSLDDEEFYHEIHYARLEGDPELFARVLAKYDVRYLIYDRSIHRRGRNSESFYQQWQTLLSPQCPLVHQSDLIQVYDCGSHSDHYLQAPKNYFVSNTSQTHQFYDPRIALTRHYVTGSESETIDSPFAFLFQREPGREHFTYREASAGAHVIEVTADLPGQDYQELVLPSLVDASRSSFLISLQHEDQEQYLMTISPLFDLYINEKKQEAYQPLELLLPSLATDGEVYFDFGTDYTLLTPDVATGSAIVSLGEFDHTQSWRYFPAGRARTQGRNINVSLQDTVELEIPPEIWDFWRHPEPISLHEPLTSLRAQVTTLPIYLRSFATQDAVNCDVIYRGQVDRQPYGEHGYDYQVDNHGSYCDTFYDVHLDSIKHSFWLRADSQNLQGMPLTYYSWDINAQVQSWETLLPAGEVTQTFSFPRTLADEKTAFFDVHTANRSIAGEPTHNILEQNIAYVVPTRELAGITLRGSAASDSQLNPVRIQEVKKSGTSQYQAQISLQGTGEGLLVLTQGYHQGWQAKIKDQLLPHERFDDWANAWKIDPALCPDTCEVEISFWPQWFGWLGLAISIALGGTCGVALGWLTWRHYHFGEHPTSLKQTFAGHKREPATTPDTPTAAVSRL